MDSIALVYRANLIVVGIKVSPHRGESDPPRNTNAYYIIYTDATLLRESSRTSACLKAIRCRRGIGSVADQLLAGDEMCGSGPGMMRLSVAFAVALQV